MKSVPSPAFKAGVYDPSNRRAESNSYWQWTNGERESDWDLAAEMVNRGWPARCDFISPTDKWFGFLAGKDKRFWVYRIYAGGKDRFGREGRYFFVLIRLESAEQLSSPEVAGLFHYFETERNLPLRTAPLGEGWEGKVPNEFLKLVAREVRSGRNTGHWGVDNSSEIITFQTEKDRTPAAKSKKSSLGRSPSQNSSQQGSGLLSIILHVSRPVRMASKFWKKYYKISTVSAFLLILLILGRAGWQKWNQEMPEAPPEPPHQKPTLPFPMDASPEVDLENTQSSRPLPTKDEDEETPAEEVPHPEDDESGTNQNPDKP